MLRSDCTCRTLPSIEFVSMRERIFLWMEEWWGLGLALLTHILSHISLLFLLGCFYVVYCAFTFYVALDCSQSNNHWNFVRLKSKKRNSKIFSFCFVWFNNNIYNLLSFSPQIDSFILCFLFNKYFFCYILDNILC